MSAIKEHYHDEICKGQMEANRDEWPILFSTLMVQAITDVRKTQTRRIVKPQSRKAISFKVAVMPDGTKRPFDIDEDEGMLDYIKCPYGKPGDVLWVRETFYAYGHWTLVTITQVNSVKKEWHFHDMTLSEGKIYLYEDCQPEVILKGRFGLGYFKRPSIFMPKAACRIKGLIKNIRVERLQNITDEDAIAEGIEIAKEHQHLPKYKNYASNMFFLNPVKSYKSLWESINGKGSWEKNSWVWVISFEVEEILK